jgi:TIR domain
MLDDAKVFLSYSRDEVPFVRAVADELELRGVDASLAESRLEPAAAFHESLDEMLGAAKLMILFVSNASLESSWINFEIGAAVGRGKPVLPVFLTETARLAAPSVISGRSGIEAYRLKPDEVAEQILDAVKAA